MSRHGNPRRVWLTGSAILLQVALGGPVQSAFTPDGWIADWLIFAPVSKSGLGDPSEDLLRLDYLTDGFNFFESTIIPDEGLVVSPDFQGAAAAETFHPILGSDVQDGAWQHLDTRALSFGDTVELYEFYGAGVGQGIEQAVVYAVVYLGNPKNETLRTRMELASDDSILVKLDDCEVFQRRVNRSFGESGTVQDTVAVEIAPGSHRLLVKAFNNGGDFGFRLRFTDPSTGAPITDTTTPAIRSSLVPEDLGVKLIKPVGLALRREVTPELVIGLDKVSHVVLKALVTFAKLDGATRVTVRERLPGGTLLEPGSARPVPSSQEGNLITWELSVEEVLHDIHYDVRYERALGDCIQGEFEVGEDPACTSSVTGVSCVSARVLDGLFLGDIVGGGDGTGTKPEEVVGIDPATGAFVTSFLGRINEPGGTDLLTPVDQTPWIDSVFFLGGHEPINTLGIPFEFDREDSFDLGCWDHILANRSHNMAIPELGIDRIRMAGREDISSAVGINASAGVTFDLDALREAYGDDEIGTFSTFAGLEDVSACITFFGVDKQIKCRSQPLDCAKLTLYVIYSNEERILSEHTWKRKFENGEAETYKGAIPEEARFLTLGAGNNAGSLNCAHGVFAEARILPKSQLFARGDPNDTGRADLSDAVFILRYLFLGGERPDCMDAADTDDDGRVLLGDAVFLLNYLFQGGEAPPAPGPAGCGREPEGSLDNLDCQTYQSCP